MLRLTGIVVLLQGIVQLGILFMQMAPIALSLAIVDLMVAAIRCPNAIQPIAHRLAMRMHAPCMDLTPDSQPVIRSQANLLFALLCQQTG